MTTPVRIAQLSCGPEYSGVQKEIDQAAKAVDAEIFYPDISLADIKRDFTAFGLDVRSPDLKLAIARAKHLLREGSRQTRSLSPPVSAVPRRLLSGTSSGGTSTRIPNSRSSVIRSPNVPPRGPYSRGWKP